MKYKQVEIGQIYYIKRFAEIGIAKSKRKGSVYIELQRGQGVKVKAGELSDYNDVKDIIQ